MRLFGGAVTGVLCLHDLERSAVKMPLDSGDIDLAAMMRDTSRVESNGGQVMAGGAVECLVGALF